MAEEITPDSEQAIAVEDIAEDSFTDAPVGEIISFVKGKFSKAETARRGDEERWIQAYRNYRGLYAPEVQFTSTEKSKVFVKITKSKEMADYGQIIQVL